MRVNHFEEGRDHHLREIGRRLLYAIPTLIGVSIVAFSLIRLVPGDPVRMMLGERAGSPEMMAEMRTNLGLDKPVIEQYFHFVGRAIQGDLGQSIISRRPVMDEFMSRFPATLELGFIAIIFSILIGVPIGVIAAVKRSQFWDYLLMGGALIGYSMPIFWWGLVLIMIFSVDFGLTPVSGRMSVLYDVDPVTGFMLLDVWLSDALLNSERWAAFREVVRHLILPSIVLGTIPLAATARITRSSVLEVLREDYIRTARAKGLSAQAVVLRHALRNALVPIITVIGLMVGTILTGAVLTETIFSWPGIGKWIVASVEARDYPVIQGGVLLISATVILVNLIVDIIYRWSNPLLRE